MSSTPDSANLFKGHLQLEETCQKNCQETGKFKPSTCETTASRANFTLLAGAGPKTSCAIEPGAAFGSLKN